MSWNILTYSDVFRFINDNGEKIQTAKAIKAIPCAPGSRISPLFIFLKISAKRIAIGIQVSRR